jgi:uncharacterized protein (DUF1499 family)
VGNSREKQNTESKIGGPGPKIQVGGTVMIRRYVFMLVFPAILLGCSTDKTIKTGVSNDRMSPCPKSPNCVSSLSEDESHQVEPLTYNGPLEEAREKLISVINSMKRSKVVIAEDYYIHATFTSFLFRFVDDVEFSFDDARKIIDVRSASRTGYSDLGVNRRRVEEIRQRFATR